MPRPGTEIAIVDQAPVSSAILATDQCFMIAQAQRGPVDRVTRLRSLRDYERWHGPRSGAPQTHDAVRAYFGEGGSTIYFSRLAGPNAAPATGDVGPLKATASSPGTWGNTTSVALEAPSGLAAAFEARKATQKTRKRSAGAEAAQTASNGGNGNGTPAVPGRVTVRVDGRIVERSRPLSSAGDAVAWALATSQYVDLTAQDAGATLNPVAPVTLSGGASDSNIDVDTVTAALGRFTAALGPGQVIYPGATNFDMHAAVMAHCDTFKRVCLLDLADDGEPTTLAADTVALYDVPGVRMTAAMGWRMIVPGPAPGTSVTVPYSAVQAAIIARNDRVGNPNQPAAGVSGISAFATGHTGPDLDDDTREQLNEIGVTLPIVRYGSVRTYGSRTAAGPDDPIWMWFNNSRLVMAVAFESEAIAETYVHRQIDGRRVLFTALETELRGVCLRYFNLGALYGETPAEAFRVDVGEALNTVETISRGEVHAAIFLHLSPPAEWVRIEIVRVPLEAVV